MVMSDVKMRIYDVMNDVTSVIYWADEEEYQLAEKLMTEMGIVLGRCDDLADNEPGFRVENLDQFRALDRLKRSLERSSSKSLDPPSLKMDIYTQATGVQMTLAWRNEDEYQLGKKFLIDVGALYFPSGEEPRRDKPEFFCFENREQLESLFEFRRSLREKAKR